MGAKTFAADSLSGQAMTCSLENPADTCVGESGLGLVANWVYPLVRCFGHAEDYAWSLSSCMERDSVRQVGSCCARPSIFSVKD